MAIEDAVMLVRCLEAVNGDDFESAFRVYEANRQERVAKVQRASDEDHISRGEADASWLFGYDVTMDDITDVDIDSNLAKR